MSGMPQASLKESMAAYSSLVKSRMDKFLPQEFCDSKLVEAMRYSAMSDGKRIRPFLLIASAQILGVAPFLSLNAAVAIEFVHVYSLIHDDLPAMDDDDTRRGIATCHKKFNEATAILAGDSLLTYAFEILSDSETAKSPEVRCELVKILSQAAGFRGMAGGQMMDLEKANQAISNEELAKLQRLKTGELFMAAAEMGAALGCASTEKRNALRYFAHDLGLAFQIKDDILDHHGTNIGKVGIDETTHKKPQDNASIVDIVGMEAAEKRLNLLKEQAINHLGIFEGKATLLSELAEFITTRNK